MERDGGGGAGADLVAVEHEERRGRRRERVLPGGADPTRAGVVLDVEAVADAANEVRRQVRPAPERRHGSSVSERDLVQSWQRRCRYARPHAHGTPDSANITYVLSLPRNGNRITSNMITIGVH